MAALLGGRDAEVAGGAVGVPRIDQHGVNPAGVGGQMAAIDVERRGLDFVRCEERGGGRRFGRDDSGKIGAATRFDAGAHGSPEKSAGQGGGRVHQASTLTTARKNSGNVKGKSGENEKPGKRNDGVVRGTARCACGAWRRGGAAWHRPGAATRRAHSDPGAEWLR